MWASGLGGLGPAAADRDSNYVSTQKDEDPDSVWYTGKGKAMSNMPAYQTLYAWRRTA